jgi:hypothetical protein
MIHGPDNLMAFVYHRANWTGVVGWFIPALLISLCIVWVYYLVDGIEPSRLFAELKLGRKCWFLGYKCFHGVLVCIRAPGIGWVLLLTDLPFTEIMRLVVGWSFAVPVLLGEFPVSETLVRRWRTFGYDVLYPLDWKISPW